MRTLQYFLFLPLLLAAAITAEAQDRPLRGPAPFGSIAGQVVDTDTDAGIPSATVAVWRSADSTLVTGAVTDDRGRFLIEGVGAGDYYVVVRFLGYATQSISDVAIHRDNPRVDLGSVGLTSDMEMLEEIQITEKREPVQIKIDRTVYNTADDPISAGGTATNVLENIPSVDVDIDGNVSLRGSGNVAILINGRPAPVSPDFVASYLKQLPAGAIDRVEVMPNPSARYDPEGMGGIINIVLKEDADTGLGGTLTAGVDQRGGYSATGMFTFGKGPVTLAASYGFRREEDIAFGQSFRINRYADPLTYLDQNEDEDESGTSHMVNFSADYALSKKTTLNSSAQFGTQSEVERELNTYSQLDAGRDPLLNYVRNSVEDDSRWNADFRIGLTHDFGSPSARKAGGDTGGGGRRGRWMRGNRGGGGSSGGAGLGSHALSIEARLNTSMNDSDQEYVEELFETGALRERQLATNERDHERGSLKIDYVRPLGSFRFETGYSGDYEGLHSNLFSRTLDQTTGEFEPDVNLNNVFDYDEQIHAGYAQLAREFGALGLQAGLRVESATTTFTLFNTNEAFDNNYVSLFPSAFLTFKLNEANTLKASYSRRINRPRTWFLNPFPSFDDPLNVRIGNPYLGPEYVDAMEAGYVRFMSWGSLTLTPYYRRTTNEIRRYQQVREDGVTVRTVENFDSSDSFGLEMIGSFQGSGVLSGIRGYASVEGYQVNTNGTNVDADFQNKAFGWGGRVNMTYQLGNRFGIGGLDFQGNLFYRAPMDTEQGRRGSMTFINLAVRQQFLGDRGSLSLTLRDPFKLAGFSYRLDQPSLYQDFERSWGAQQVAVTLSYTFGRSDEKRRDRNEGGGFDDMQME